MKASLAIRDLAALWAQYLEMLEDNAAIDVSRISEQQS